MSDLEDCVSTEGTENDCDDDGEDEDEDEDETEGEDIQGTSDETEESDVLEGQGREPGALDADSNGSPPMKRSRRDLDAPGLVAAKDRVIALLKIEVSRLRAKRDQALDDIVRLERAHLRTLSFLAAQTSALQEHARMMAVSGIARGSRATTGTSFGQTHRR